MSAHVVRRVLALAGAGALAITGVVGVAGPAAATDAKVVTSLPANVRVVADQAVTVAVPLSPVCAAGFTEFMAFIPGHQDGVTLALGSVPNTAICNGTTLNATVTPTASKNRNAVVKFTSMVNGAKVVQTLVVHVAKAKPGKPA